MTIIRYETSHASNHKWKTFEFFFWQKKMCQSVSVCLVFESNRIESNCRPPSPLPTLSSRPPKRSDAMCVCQMHWTVKKNEFVISFVRDVHLWLLHIVYEDIYDEREIEIFVELCKKKLFNFSHGPVFSLCSRTGTQFGNGL